MSQESARFNSRVLQSAGRLALPGPAPSCFLLPLQGRHSLSSQATWRVRTAFSPGPLPSAPRGNRSSDLHFSQRRVCSGAGSRPSRSASPGGLGGRGLGLVSASCQLRPLSTFTLRRRSRTARVQTLILPRRTPGSTLPWPSKAPLAIPLSSPCPHPLGSSQTTSSQGGLPLQGSLECPW